jgi:uncharacterized protein YqeY
MTLKESLVADMKVAMRDKEKVRLETIRLLRAAIQRKEVDERIELDDEGVLLIVQKLVKQCTDAEDQFTQGNRDDLAQKERENIAVLQTYLPEPLSDSEIESLIKQAIEKTGASTMKEMGQVMGIVKTGAQGRADMGKVSATIKSLLS